MVGLRTHTSIPKIALGPWKAHSRYFTCSEENRFGEDKDIVNNWLSVVTTHSESSAEDRAMDPIMPEAKSDDHFFTKTNLSMDFVSFSALTEKNIKVQFLDPASTPLDMVSKLVRGKSGPGLHDKSHTYSPERKSTNAPVSVPANS